MLQPLDHSHAAANGSRPIRGSRFQQEMAAIIFKVRGGLRDSAYFVQLTRAK